MTRGMNGKETGREIMAQPSSLPPSLIAGSLSHISLSSPGPNLREIEGSGEEMRERDVEGLVRSLTSSFLT